MRQITLITASSMVLFALSPIWLAHAEYQRTHPGDTVTIGEYVFDDDYVATTTPCTIGISDPANTIKIASTTPMSSLTDGWHYYDYPVPSNATLGIWPTIMICGSANRGDLIKKEKSFVVEAGEVSTSTISAAVWSATTRTLTSAGLTTGSLATQSDVNSASSSLGSLIQSSSNSILSSIQTSSSSIASAIQAANASIDSYISSIILSASSSLNAAIASSASGVTSAVNSNTGSVVSSASSSLSGAILANRALISGLNNISASDVWAYGSRALTDYNTSAIAAAAASSVWGAPTRNLTDYGNNLSASEVWNIASSQLTSAGTIGKLLADNIDAQISTRSSLTLAELTTKIQQATTTIINEVLANRTLIENLNTISASDVWNYGNRSLSGFSTSTLASDTAAAVWQKASNQLSTTGSIGKLLVDNIDTQISTRGTSSLTAADVWNSAARTLTDYATTSVSQAVATAVWSGATRTLTNNGNDITAADVWNVLSSSLTNIGTVGKAVTDNLDAKVSTRGTSSLTANDIWTAATRTLTDYATSSLAAAVWANSTRALTNNGNDITAADVWNQVTSGMNSVGTVGKLLIDNIDAQISSRASSASIAGWTVTLANPSSVETGHTYRAKITILNSQSAPQAPYAAPAITLYDSSRNTIVSGGSMTQIGTGIYEYTYSIPSNAAQGIWETVISTQVESGKTISNTDYWSVSGSPAQVIINDVTATTSASNGDLNVSANLTITNEGLTGYEYQYEWCVVSQESNACGGGDDTYRGTGAKFINSGEDWNTDLTAAVPTSGSYFFKVLVYFGTEKSGSSRTFSIAGTDSGGGDEGTGGTGGTGGTTSGGGGGGGSQAASPAPLAPATCTTGKGADVNCDNKVSSTDFSIMMSFWKTKGPFKNANVDLNKDGKVDSIDFSILLSQWGTSGKQL